MESNQTAKPIVMVVFPLLSLKKGQANYLNSKGIRADDLSEGKLCIWRLEHTFIHWNPRYFVKLELLHETVILLQYYHLLSKL